MTNNFVVNKTYSTRSICDHESVYFVKVVKKTAKTVTIISDGNETRCKVHEYEGKQFFYPFGKYSMCPIIRA